MTWLSPMAWFQVTCPVLPQRSAAIYNATIDAFEVEQAVRYQRDEKGRTKCNIFVWDVTTALAAQIPHFAVVGTKVKELTANDTYVWLSGEPGRLNGWRETTAEVAAANARIGFPTVATQPNPKGIGHVAVVLPSREGDELWVAQAGAINTRRSPLSRCFSKSLPVKFFTHN